MTSWEQTLWSSPLGLSTGQACPVTDPLGEHVEGGGDSPQLLAGTGRPPISRWPLGAVSTGPGALWRAAWPWEGATEGSAGHLTAEWMLRLGLTVSTMRKLNPKKGPISPGPPVNQRNTGAHSRSPGLMSILAQVPRIFPDDLRVPLKA